MGAKLKFKEPKAVVKEIAKAKGAGTKMRSRNPELEAEKNQK